jgi:ferredoxin-NADP reductase
MAPKPSTFKKALTEMKNGTKIVASQLSGDFVMTEKPEEKLVLIAGGIGVTPFRSMVKNMIDLNLEKDIVLFYSNVMAEDFVYKDIFSQAVKNGLKTVYILTDRARAPVNWKGKTGYINAQMIESEVSDFKNRRYYLSGPTAMVNSYKKLLASLGISQNQIVTDYFPGF